MPLFGYKSDVTPAPTEVDVLTERVNANAVNHDYLVDRARRLSAELHAVKDEYNEIAAVTQNAIDALSALQNHALSAADEAEVTAIDIFHAAS